MIKWLARILEVDADDLSALLAVWFITILLPCLLLWVAFVMIVTK